MKSYAMRHKNRNDFGSLKLNDGDQTKIMNFKIRHRSFLQLMKYGPLFMRKRDAPPTRPFSRIDVVLALTCDYRWVCAPAGLSSRRWVIPDSLVIYQDGGVNFGSISASIMLFVL